MTETTAPKAPKKRATAAKTSKNPAKPRKAAAGKAKPKDTPSMSDTTTNNRTEAKSRFNAALEEAKAGAAALKAEAGDRATAYRAQAQGKGEDWLIEAKAYGEDAKVKGKELATEGKVKASEGIRSLGQVVAENAHVVDEKLGAKYGDYARSASRSLSQTADKLDQKSVDDLGEDAREFVRKSPGLAVGIAAIAGFMLSRLFRGSR